MSASATARLDSSIPLSPVESMFWTLERAQAGSFRVTLVMWIDGQVQADILGAALARLQHRHPKLRAAIAGGGEEALRFEFADTIPPIPAEVIKYSDGEAPWREEALRMNQRRFPSSGPLMSVTALCHSEFHSSVLLLTMHHSVADGLSAIMLVNDLLVEYAAAEANVDPRPNLRPATAAGAKVSSGWRGRVRLLRRMIRIQRTRFGSPQSALPHVANIPPMSQWLHWAIPPNDTLRMARICRRAHTSVTGVLIAAVLCSLMDCLPAPQALFKCAIPFSLREGLAGMDGPITGQDLGCFVSIMNEYYQLSQQPNLWDIAKRIHQSQQEFVSLDGPAFYYNLAAAVTSKSMQRLKPERMVGTPDRVTLLATNYGTVDDRSQYGSLVPRACTLILNQDRFGPSLVLEALVLQQRLNIGLAADGLDPAFWAQLQVAFRRRLNDTLGPDPGQVS